MTYIPFAERIRAKLSHNAIFTRVNGKPHPPLFVQRLIMRRWGCKPRSYNFSQLRRMEAANRARIDYRRRQSNDRY